MIIQCEKCKTRFRLDDSRVSDKGVKVRCTKCKNVFRVQKEKTDIDTLAAGGALTSLSHAAALDDSQAVISEEWSFPAESNPPPVADSIVFDDAPLDGGASSFTPPEAQTFDVSEFSFDTEEIPAAEDVQVSANDSSSAGDVDFSGFDFGEIDSVSEPDSETESTLTADDFTSPGSTSVQKGKVQGLDFSDDDMFGAAAHAAPEVSPDTITFDFEGGSFTDSMDMSGQDTSGISANMFSLESSGEVPFSLGEIDFGDELTAVAVQQVNPDDLKPSQEVLFAPLAEAKVKSADEILAQSFFEDTTPEDQQELPPLSITSRRKQDPMLGIMIAIVVLLLIPASAYFGYISLYAPKEASSPESGKISVSGVKSTFAKSSVAGELLVVSGEVFNEYSKPRAALQVMVTVSDLAGQSIVTKKAYGGNPLTEEQIKKLPLEKIEAAMANQFGDSLANMEVAPGKSIPFVVVLAKLPAGARDFEVQSAGSMAVTGKQQ